MKIFKKTKGKRLLALLIAVAVCLTTFPLAAVAADLSSGSAALDQGSSLQTVDSQEGMDLEWISGEIPSNGVSLFASGLKKTGVLYTLYQTSFPNGRPGSTNTWGTLTTCVSHMMETGGVYNAAYCIDQELGYQSGASHTTDGTSLSDISTAKQKVMGFILANGFQWNSSSYWSQGDNDRWLATQLLIWAVMKGHVKLNKDTHLINVDQSVRADIVKISSKVYNATSFVAYFDSLVKTLENARKIPSFCTYPAETLGNEKLPEQELKPVTLKGTGAAYTASANDKNGVLKNFNFTGNISGVAATANGNTLKLSATEEISGTRKSSAVTYKPKGGENAVLAYRYAPNSKNYQRFACYTPSTDPVPAILSVSTDSTITTGGPKIVKWAEDDEVAGLQFGVSGSDGSYRVFTTDSNGEIDLSSLPAYDKIPVLDDEGNPVIDEETGEQLMEQGDIIVYTAQEINVPIRYVVPAPQSFTMVGGAYSTTGVEALKAAYNTKKVLSQTADPLLLFCNNLPNAEMAYREKGKLFIKIQDEDGNKLGVCYALEVINGEQVFHGYTDEYGVVSFRNFDVEQAKKATPQMELVGYFENGGFVATKEYRGDRETADFEVSFDGFFFHPLNE